MAPELTKSDEMNIEEIPEVKERLSRMAVYETRYLERYLNSAEVSVSQETVYAFAAVMQGCRIPIAMFRLSPEVLKTLYKSDQTPVTDADPAAETAMQNLLLQYNPDDSYRPEETSTVEGISGASWVMDGIDGTSEYVAGSPNWAVGLVRCEPAENGTVPVTAVIGMPARGEI